ncbi:MAG: hypothetical protein ACE5R6_15150 [Candidatus Heimdallarchaeota archaeon]
MAEALVEYLQVNPTIRAKHRPPPIGKAIKELTKMDKVGLYVYANIFKDYQAADDAWSVINQGDSTRFFQSLDTPHNFPMFVPFYPSFLFL